MSDAKLSKISKLEGRADAMAPPPGPAVVLVPFTVLLPAFLSRGPWLGGSFSSTFPVK